MKNIKCIYLFSVICIFLLYACGSKTGQKKFFDVPGYFKGEIDSIKTNYTTVSKTSVYNGDTNRQELKVMDVNWEKEFALFLECDINKPVYYANVQITPGMPIGLSYAEEYTNKSSQGPIKFLMIRKMNVSEEVQLIKISLEKNNLISSTNISLSYNPYFLTSGENPQVDIVYSIQGEQYVKSIGEKNHFSVMGRIRK